MASSIVRTKEAWDASGRPSGCNPNWYRRSHDRVKQAQMKPGRFRRIMQYGIMLHAKAALHMRLNKGRGFEEWVLFSEKHDAVARAILENVKRKAVTS